MTKEKIIQELDCFAKEKGLNNITFNILSDSANLIIHLSPYDIVAKVAVSEAPSDTVLSNMIKEIDVVNHLKRKGVNIISSNISIASGPYSLSEHYFTLWQYEQEDVNKKISSETAVDCLDKLVKGIKNYKGELPILGVWKRINQSAENLRVMNDPKIMQLIIDYDKVNNSILKIHPNDLVPSHGDAHIKNDAFVLADGWSGYKPLKDNYPNLKQTLSQKGKNFKMLHMENKRV